MERVGDAVYDVGLGYSDSPVLFSIFMHNGQEIISVPVRRGIYTNGKHRICVSSVTTIPKFNNKPIQFRQKSDILCELNYLPPW